MQANTILIVFVFLIVSVCTSYIVLNSTESEIALKIDKAAVDVISSCYGNRGKAVGVVGNSFAFLAKTLSSQEIPVVLVDQSISWVEKYAKFGRRIPYKLQVFVIAASTSKQLRETYFELRNYKIWWNHMASFVILDRSSNGCRISEFVLLEAWSHDMVNVNVICLNSHSRVIILGYHPHTSQALNPWRFRSPISDQRRNVSIAIFQRPYQEGMKICTNFQINNGKNLYNNIIYIGDYNMACKTTKKITRKARCYHDVSMWKSLLETTFRAMNASPMLIMANAAGPRFIHVTTQTTPNPLASGLNFSISRSFMQSGVVAITQHAGFKSQLEKILLVIDQQSRYGLYIVILLTLGFLKFIVGHSLMPAALNIVRIICNSGFENLPPNTAPRFYLTGILLFAVTMQGIYQGNLASLLTTELRRPNINTWHDLAESNHTIYTYKGFMTLFEDSIFAGRLIELNYNEECIYYVLNDSSAACVGNEVILMDYAEEFKLHLSKVLVRTFRAFPLRDEWPYKTQFNIVLGRLFEADLVVPFSLRTKQRILSYSNNDVDAVDGEQVRSINLRNLGFAFIILGIGLVCASIIFIVEIVIHRFCSRVRIRSVCFRRWRR